ncbi:MAG: ParB/Srx family N-terminal domain-containing protein [Candidatus Nanohaloarchaea archaeon]
MSPDVVLEEEVQLVSVDELLPYVNNPKEHPEEQIDRIASSIKNYGWDVPLVVTEDYEVIKGHGRLQAAKKLGLEKVPVIQRDDLTEAEVKGARIADNRTSESSWNDELLAQELEELTSKDQELPTGFGQEEIDDYIDIAEELKSDDIDEEEFDEEEMEYENECPNCGYEW